MHIGKIILEIAMVVISLTAYTFWAVKRGHDFNFLGPFLFAVIMVLMVFSLILVEWIYFDSHKGLFG
jgi:protein lifeguard